MSQNIETEAAGVPKPLRPAFCRGWCDGLRQAGLPGEFDGWSVDQQLYYEYGRLEAANVRHAGLPRILVEGHSPRDCGLIVALGIHAERLVGAAIPPEVAA